MKTAALVIKTYGNQELAKSMASAMESTELKKLRAKLEMREHRDHDYYQMKTIEARRKYKVKPMSPFKQRLYGAVGLIMVLSGVA